MASGLRNTMLIRDFWEEFLQRWEVSQDLQIKKLKITSKEVNLTDSPQIGLTSIIQWDYMVHKVIVTLNSLKATAIEFPLPILSFHTVKGLNINHCLKNRELLRENTTSPKSYFYKSFTFLFNLDVRENNLRQDKLNKSYFSLIWKRHYYYTPQQELARDFSVIITVTAIIRLQRINKIKPNQIHYTLMISHRQQQTPL